MPNLHDLPGQRLGTLLVLGRLRNQRGNQARFVCRCDNCGKEHIRLASALCAGKVEPCDCGKAPADQPAGTAGQPAPSRRRRPAMTSEADAGPGPAEGGDE